MKQIDISKNVFAAICVIMVGIMQIVACALGFNGQIFAFTSALIGGITGFILGITIKDTRK